MRQRAHYGLVHPAECTLWLTDRLLPFLHRPSLLRYCYSRLGVGVARLRSPHDRSVSLHCRSVRFYSECMTIKSTFCMARTVYNGQLASLGENAALRLRKEQILCHSMHYPIVFIDSTQ